jgi:hypothetical protein
MKEGTISGGKITINHKAAVLNRPHTATFTFTFTSLSLHVPFKSAQATYTA